MGTAKAGLFKEEGKESEENEEKRVGSWQWAKGKRVLSEDKIVGSQQSAVGSGQARKRVFAAVYIENLMGGSEKDCAYGVFVFEGGNVNKANDYYLDAAKILKKPS